MKRANRIAGGAMFCLFLGMAQGVGAAPDPYGYGNFDSVMTNVGGSNIWAMIIVIAPEILPPDFSLDPVTCDMNGGLDTSGEPIVLLPNGILESDEFALLAAILANPNWDCSASGGASHTIIDDAWNQNYAEVYYCLGGGQGGPEHLLPPNSMIPDVEFLFCAYMTLGDWDSLAFPMLIMGFVNEPLVQQYINDPNLHEPVIANFALMNDYLAWCGDADGDGCSNLNEHNYYRPAGRAAYLSAAMNPAQTPPGCSDDPICEGNRDTDWIYNPATTHYYRITESKLTWPECRDEAIRWDGYLSTINNADENEWVKSKYPIFGDLYIGFNDEDVEGTFVWVNGEPVTYTNWNDGEPNNAGGEDYAELYSNGGWNDIYESQANHGVIERDIAPVNFFGPFPPNQTVEIGGEASFYVVVRRTVGNVTYQWRHDGTDVPGATSSVYTFVPEQVEDGGSYTCFLADDTPASFLTWPVSLTVILEGSMPGVGFVGLALLAIACAVAGTYVLCRRRRPRASTVS